MYGDETWAREQTVPKRLAATEYRKHGLGEAELILDLGDRPEYSGADVLDALGY